MAKTNKKSNVSTLVALGAGAVALAASTYYLFGPEGKIHRKKAAGWMIKLKGEIVDKLEDAGEITGAVYQNIVDSVVTNYKTASIHAGDIKVSPAEIAVFAAGLKSQWKNIVKTLRPKNTKKSGTKKSAAKKKKA